jgi:Flp pilus assembly CpaF family ATPase
VPPILFRPDRAERPGPATGNGHHPGVLHLPPAPRQAPLQPPTPSAAGEPFVYVPPAPEPASPPVDYEVVRSLQGLVIDRVRDRVRGRDITNDEQRTITAEETRKLVREHAEHRIEAGDLLPAGYEDALFGAVTAYLLGFGRLQPLIDDDSIENIQVLGWDRVRVEYADGRVDGTSYTAAASDGELVELLQRLAARGGSTERTLSTSKPVLHLRLPDGSRMVAAYVVTPRPVIVIRRHRILKVSLDDLVNRGSITATLAGFLRAAVGGYLNIMIAGLPNSGKTTMLRAIASEIPADEWFATMETEYELGLDRGHHRWAVAFEERQGHGEIGPNGRPEGELSLADLFPHMLRMSVQRVVVGEVRSAEVVSMLDAGDTTQGTLSTIHARYPHNVFDRLAGLLMRYGASPNRDGAYIQVASALDLVVFVNMQRRRGQSARRYVSHVIEVNGLAESGGIARSELFAPRTYGGLAEPTGVRPSERILEALAYAGFDLQALTAPDGGWHRSRG